MTIWKTKKLSVALVHGVVYSLPFALLHPSGQALIAIVLSHAVIDRFRVARYVVWLKNLTGPGGDALRDCGPTGFPKDVPEWQAGWLFVIVDNVLHVVINGAAIKWL